NKDKFLKLVVFFSTNEKSLNAVKSTFNRIQASSSLPNYAPGRHRQCCYNSVFKTSATSKDKFKKTRFFVLAIYAIK
ncbi:hypothetical protein, partial [Lactiplantibacillus plantarum]|uniref:hypothetical protein n=1 Tax=Lactiplantibacillus plantarum TaxID=1590 RepID=UPI001E52BAB2